MMRRMLFAAVMIAALTPFIEAQSFESGSAPVPPSYCKPCLFYGGDFSPKAAKANGLFNGYSEVAQGQVYVPFTVPTGRTWTVTGAFVNVLTGAASLYPASTPWSIWTGLSQGQAGTQVGGCRNNATMTPTGREGLGYKEYTVLIHFSSSCYVKLTTGTYWLNILPQDLVNYSLFYLSDVEVEPAPHQWGPLEPADQSFATSGSFGTYFTPAAGTDFGGCAGAGCDRFSVGVIGTSN